MFQKVDPKQKFSEVEKKIADFWEREKIFKKSLEIRRNCPLYSFFDGPPFATGTPHYGHIVASTMKDVVPRYWTMRGYFVPRVWGWDCHGLPIENIAEQELGIKRKKEILERYGVEEFNRICRSKVLGYVDEWKKVIRRLGRWADMENAYSTMDTKFMESVWWVFKELWDRGLIYEDYRSMHICPRCETTLSQSEVAEGYAEIKDISATVKFELVDEPGTFILAWTTTPWTLIANATLAVGKDIEYVKVRSIKAGKQMKGKTEYENYIIAKNIFDSLVEKEDQDPLKVAFNFSSSSLKDKDEKNFEFPVIIDMFRGSKLAGKIYKPLFSYYSADEKLPNRENGWKIYPADFVTTEEGTGVVHIAPAFGEDDLNMGQKLSLPFIQHVGLDGVIKSKAKDFAGLDVKPSEDHTKTDKKIIEYLKDKDLVFAFGEYFHSYPHCWRCETPLLNYATSSWFVKVTAIKEKAIELAKKINWTPDHMKEGRFGKWLEGARDWSISRQRFWASVIPIWKCSCGEIKVMGSIAELEELAGKKVIDLHKHTVDKIRFPCAKCGGKMKRIPDVLDTWFDSGSMPYAQLHYPFEKKHEFEKSFPADFIAEGQDQTRAWFYYLHVIAAAIKESNAFKNVIVNGIVLAEDGKKMSKRLKNYPDPMEVIEQYGADALRLYLMGSPVVEAQDLNFSEKNVAEIQRGMLRMLWNSYSFFALYAGIDKYNPKKAYDSVGQKKNLLDRWIISEFNELAGRVNDGMERYKINEAVRQFASFIDNLSNWYIRRSRKRFWKSENDSDKLEAYDTLYFVLVELAKLMAPFAPFIAEEIYKNLSGKLSVHLEDYPVAIDELKNGELNENMRKVREFVKIGLAARAQVGIKVRQPLSELRINHQLPDELMELIKEEVNVKKIAFSLIEEKKGWAILKENLFEIGLNIVISEELRLEGEARELIRRIQELRKKAGFEVDDRIQLCYSGGSKIFKIFGEFIAREVLASGVTQGEIPGAEIEELIELEEEPIKVWIKRI